jgi:hypothetical protein
MSLTTRSLLLLLAACHGPSDSSPTDTEADADTDADSDADSDTDTDVSESGPILVYFTADTLSATAAKDTDWCGHLQAVVADYGLDLACVDGGVSPSSWTGEAHTRMLWPQHLDGALRRNEAPACETSSVLANVKDATDGYLLFGGDNSVLSSRGKEPCADGSTAFSQDADVYEETYLEVNELADVVEADRPVHATIDAFETRIAAGGSVQLFLNAVEVGGHQPRCWFAPTTPSCSALWDIASSPEAHLVAPSANRRDTWLRGDFNQQLLAFLSTAYVDRQDELRPLMHQSTLEAVDAFRDEMFEARLRRVLDAVQGAGRLGDVTLLILADHGENPCVDRGFDGTLNCAHAGLTTEWTGNVPVFVSPASLAQQWADDGLIGDGDHPWQTSNLAYAILDRYDLPTPTDWPAQPVPVGEATSWTCRTSGQEAANYSGVRIVGDESVRCVDGECAGKSWGVPFDVSYDPVAFDTIPASVAAYAAAPDWFGTACGESP